MEDFRKIKYQWQSKNKSESWSLTTEDLDNSSVNKIVIYPVEMKNKNDPLKSTQILETTKYDLHLKPLELKKTSKDNSRSVELNSSLKSSELNLDKITDDFTEASFNIAKNDLQPSVSNRGLVKSMKSFFHEKHYDSNFFQAIFLNDRNIHKTSKDDIQSSPYSNRPTYHLPLENVAEKLAYVDIKEKILFEFVHPILFLGFWMIQILLSIFRCIVGGYLFFRVNPFYKFISELTINMLNFNESSFVYPNDIIKRIIEDSTKKSGETYALLGIIDALFSITLFISHIVGFLGYFKQQNGKLIPYFVILACDFVIYTIISISIFILQRQFLRTFIATMFYSTTGNCTICQSNFTESHGYTAFDELVFFQACKLQCCGIDSMDIFKNHMKDKTLFTAPAVCCQTNLTDGLNQIDLCQTPLLSHNDHLQCPNNSYYDNCFNSLHNTKEFHNISLSNFFIASFYFVVITIDFFELIFLLVIICKS